MVCHSYGKAEPCLTSGGGAPNPAAIGFAQSFCSRITQIYQCRFNGFRRFLGLQKETVETVSMWQRSLHPAEAG